MPKSKNKAKSKLNRTTVTNYVVIVVIGGLIGFVILFAIGSILTFGNGGIKGYLLEHKKFPGANSQEISAGRAQINDEFNSLNKTVADLPVKALYISPLVYKYDVCVKGEHTSGFAGGSYDSYAYSCWLDTARVYAYTQPRCTIYNYLNKVKDLATSYLCNLNKPNDSFSSKTENKYTGGYDISVVIVDTSNFFKTPSTWINPYGCEGVRLVYCNSQKTVDVAKQIPPSAKTIVLVKTQSTYYQK